VSVLGLSLRAMIRAYQYLISPLLGPTCRYLPSCSEYASEAIATHGPVAGTWLGIKRICRCHHWGGHGYDPVPSPDTAPRSCARHTLQVK
jgi:putative membrane protein insertion efficiency factor